MTAPGCGRRAEGEAMSEWNEPSLFDLPEGTSVELHGSVRAMLKVRQATDGTEAHLGIFAPAGTLDSRSVAEIADALRAAMTWAVPASHPAADPPNAGTSDTGTCPA